VCYNIKRKQAHVIPDVNKRVAMLPSMASACKSLTFSHKFPGPGNEQ